jgi:beta-carotene hydroxylase
MLTRVDERPNIPRALYEPSLAGSGAFVLSGLVCFVGFGLLASYVAALDVALWLRIAILVPVLLLASNGAHLLGIAGHEGVHLNLHTNKYVSAVVGCFFSAMSGFPAIGHGVAHWSHHRYTNQAGDPDVGLYPPFRSFWRRFLLARSAGQRSHLVNLFALACGWPLGFHHKLPFTALEQRRLAGLNIGFLVFWFGLYALLAFHRPLVAVMAVLLPLIITLPITGLRGYIEHAGTGVGPFRDSRSYVSPLFTALLFGNNFYLEHHLYPGVPCYRLPELHRLLEAEGYFKRHGAAVESTVLGTLRHTTSRSQYPSGSRPDFGRVLGVETPRIHAAAHMSF